MTEGNQRLDAAAPRQQLRLSASPDSSGPSSGSGATGTSQLAGLLQTGEVWSREVTDVDPDLIHPDELPGAVKSLRRVRNRLEAAETAWLATASKRQAHEADGARDAATWARDELGTSWRDAKNQLANAAKLDGLPEAKEAFTGGDISGHAASEIVKATDDERLAGRPDVEGQLVDAARRGGPDLVRKTARKLRAAASDHDKAAKDADDAHRDRYAHVHVDGRGWVKIEGHLDPVNGEAFLTAYRPLLRDMHTAGAQLQIRTREQRAADALGELARRAVAGDAVPQTAGRPARVIVTTDLDTLRRTADHPADAQLAHTGPVCAETARRIACDANIVPVVLDGNSIPIDIGRTTRTPTVAQRDCLIVRDRACRGCGAPAQICVPHHCVHWSNGGSTDLHNLVLLCFHCHQLVHEAGWTVRWNPDNTVTFTTPDGRDKIRPPP